jgi:hypothetical protein
MYLGGRTMCEVYTVSPSVLCVQTLGGGRLALGAVPVRFLS